MTSQRTQGSEERVPISPSTTSPFVIGIAGGSGSGKTTIADALSTALGEPFVAVIEQDSYYRDLSSLPFEERARVNFDHPDAIEIDLMVEHIDRLCVRQPIDKPQYDFETHLRRRATQRIEARPVILLEGILVLALEPLRERMDLKIFVDTAADIRLMRRVRRDLESRGRSFDQIRRQYYETVRPMHIAFVEPSKIHADVIVPEGGQNRVALELILGRLREIVRERS